MRVRRFVATLLGLVMFLVSLPVGVGATFTDQFVLTESVDAVFTGRVEGAEMRFNLQFDDMAWHTSTQEAVARTGALGIVRGFERGFFPDATVTRSDAIGHLMRLLGYERLVLDQVVGISAGLPPGVPLPARLELAYMFFAQANGIITSQQYEDALFEVTERQIIYNSLGSLAAQAFVLPPHMFHAFEPVTREELALWIYMALNQIDSPWWDQPDAVVSLYRYNDWWDIAAENLLAVEAVVANNIMAGSYGLFRPGNFVPRYMLAVILRNMTRIHTDLVGIGTFTGMVAGIREYEYSTMDTFTVRRVIYVRTDEGLVHQLVFEGGVSPEQITTLDAVVFRNFELVGLQNLAEGDVIEYLANVSTGELIYAQVLGEGVHTEITGILEYVDFTNNTITVSAEFDGNFHTLVLADGMAILGLDHDLSTDPPTDSRYLVMHGLSANVDGDRIHWSDLPFSARVVITLLGNVAIRIEFLGNRILLDEGSGVVLENDPTFGFLTVLEHASGEVLVLRYFENDLVVHRRAFHETGDGLGYLTQIFPYFGFDPLATTIDRVTPGDLVFFRTFADDPEVIEYISAVANYTVRHGRIVSILGGAGYTQILVQYENSLQAWFNVANAIHVTAEGRPSSIFQLQAGDWIRMLVNDAVVAPGVLVETVREINVQGPERHIGSIVRGNFLSMDRIQWRMVVENASTLTQSGWQFPPDNLRNFDLSARDIEFFNNGVQITRDDAYRYLRRTDVTVYIALDSSPFGERIRMVSFRDSQDNVFAPDTVIWASGTGAFSMLSQTGTIDADDGTIVVRNGRLVSQVDILPGDFVQVITNGTASVRAAIVNITPAPDVSQIMFARTRVIGVEEGRRFTVGGMSILEDTRWAFTPVERVFEINHNTIFWDEFGYFPAMSFSPLPPNETIGSTFTVVAEGTRAAFVVAQPYASWAIRGDILEIDAAAGIITLRDAQVLPPNMADLPTNFVHNWMPVPGQSNLVDIVVPLNSLIAKDNEIIAPTNLGALQIGDGLIVMTTPIELPMEAFPALVGYIIRVVN